MNYLEKKIKKEGKIIGDDILNVSGFLNQQVDIKLMQKIGKDFATYFKNRGITKVVTIEVSGIMPSVFVAKELNVPLIVLKKQTSKTLNDNIYKTKVHSFTKNIDYDLVVSKEFLDKNDKVLIIDDFLAVGEAARGALNLVNQAKSEVVGIGIVIEKSFQEGRKKLEDLGIDVYSIARIKKLSKGKIEFI